MSAPTRHLLRLRILLRLCLKLRRMAPTRLSASQLLKSPARSPRRSLPSKHTVAYSFHGLLLMALEIDQASAVSLLSTRTSRFRSTNPNLQLLRCPRPIPALVSNRRLLLASSRVAGSQARSSSQRRDAHRWTTPLGSSPRARRSLARRLRWKCPPTRLSTVTWKTSTTRRASGASSCKAGVRGRLHFLFLHECNELMISIASSVDMLTYIIASV